MRHICSLALLLTLLLAIAGSSPVSKAQIGKTVVIGIGQEPDRLLASTNFAGTVAQNLVYDRLVAMDEHMQPYAQLAAEVPTIENGLAAFVGEGGDRRLEVTVPLRQDVTWSDGMPFTADDVVYFFEYIMNPESGWETSLEEKIKSVDRLDDFTAKIIYLSANEAKARDPETYKDQGTDPVVDPLYFLGFNADKGFIYPRHKLREIVGDDPRSSRDIGKVATSELAQNPVGTGPYVLSSWEPGVALTFQSRGEALPHRWGVPNIDTVVFRVMPSKDSSIAALAAGEIHVASSDMLDASDAGVLDVLPGIQVQYVQGATWELLAFNLDNPILTDPNVRKAIAFGINRQELVDEILFGKSEPAASLVPSWSWAFNTEVPRYDYNPGLASQLLLESGWTPGPDGIRVKNGERLSLNYWSTPAAFRPILLPRVQDQLAQIGIEMNVDFVPAETLFEPNPSSPTSLAARQFDVVEFAWAGGAAYDPGALLSYANHSRNIPSIENGFQGGNYAGFRNARIDELLNKGMLSHDQGVRSHILAEVQQILMSELPVFPLFPRPITGAASDTLINYRPTSNGDTWNVETWDLAR
jgi:peptide/nickel transport system substrate-binding protein